MITIERCPCNQKGCRDYHLKGIGKFVQGSGFTKREAERIAKLLNAEELQPRWLAHHESGCLFFDVFLMEEANQLVEPVTVDRAFKLVYDHDFTISPEDLHLMKEQRKGNST